MARWIEYRWGDLVTLEYGKGLSNYKDGNGTTPVYGTNGPIGYTHTPLYEFPSVIVGRKGAYRGVHYSDRPFFVIDTAFYIKPKVVEIDLKFVYYYLCTVDINSMDSGSAIPSTSREDFYQLQAILPDLATQTAIAEILSSLDDKIELNNQINKNLESLAQALFKQWFIDFEFPDENGQPYKSSGGEMVESELGMIPRGWSVNSFNDIVSIQGGTTPSTKVASFWEGNLHWTSPKDLSNLIFPVLLSTEKKITHEGLSKISSGLLPKGTLLLSSRAPIGYLAITEIETAINQGYIAINTKSHISNLFLLYWLKHNMHMVIERANGSTFLEISKGNFKAINLVLPDGKLHDQFLDIVNPAFRHIVSSQIENCELAKLRDRILPDLISGRIAIRPQ